VVSFGTEDLAGMESRKLNVRGKEVPIRPSGTKLVESETDRQEFLIVEISRGDSVAAPVESLGVDSSFMSRLGTREVGPESYP
jgi:hypothetical protein